MRFEFVSVLANEIAGVGRRDDEFVPFPTERSAEAEAMESRP